jgi:hypothetical protein
MAERKVIAFRNVNPYPVSLNVAGIRGKVLLYEGDEIRDREGISLIPPESEWPWLISKGVKPVYLAEEKSPALTPREEELSTEVILDDLKLMEKKAVADTQNLVSEFLAPKPILSPEGVEAEDAPPPLSHLDRPDNPDPAKSVLVWQDRDGVWILNKDGFSSLNPAEIKKHIRRDKALGKDFLELLEWRTFGSKPEAASEVAAEAAPAAEAPLKPKPEETPDFQV